MGKRRPHCQEQEAERQGNPTKGKCAQISMLPLCSRCVDPVQSLFCSWGVSLASQGRTVVPNCYHRCGGLVPPGGKFWECQVPVSEQVLRLCHSGSSLKQHRGMTGLKRDHPGVCCFQGEANSPQQRMGGETAASLAISDSWNVPGFLCLQGGGRAERPALGVGVGG